MDVNIPVQKLNSVNFGFYHVGETKGLSVKEITNPQTFDSLSHPNPGGLHDAALGPVDRDEACGTCGQNYIHCPGHMGHISLPLPVYNPVYFKTMYQILRGSCFNCHRLTIPPLAAYTFVQKMDLLEKGKLIAVGELEEYVSHLLQEFGNGTDVEETVRGLIDEFLSKQAKDEENDISIDHTVKNIQAVKNKLISNFIAKFFMLLTLKCPHCKNKKRQLRQDNYVRLHLGGIRKIDKHDKQGDTSKIDKSNEEEAEVNNLSEKSLVDIESGDLDDSVNFTSQEQTFITPAQARDHMRLLWVADKVILRCLFKSLSAGASEHQSADIFFLEVLPVPPTRFRPVAMMKGLKFENSQTANLSRVIGDCSRIHQLLDVINQKQDSEELVQPKVLSEVPGDTVIEKLHNAWDQMQVHVNCIVDSDLDKLSTNKQQGIKQLLEKKEGLFRKHMMGKRVNFAARSVISPDPCINTNEIGVPEVFATKLTYAQPVTPWNIHELRQAVINGPDVHPGACFVMNEDGTKVMLSAKDKTLREAVAKQLLTPSTNPLTFRECKKVYRHLKNGDVMLLNRQPTLHRPSIQAHKVRVLPKEKTLRMHYANCKAYNADFDGDEMNAHFPQNELARAEAYSIASTDFQYLVPKDGTPLAGLIQDHMVSGVNLTMRGRFFNREDYCKLVFAALVDQRGRIKTLPPSIVKPCKLWSGKQVLSTIILNIIPSNKKPLHMTGKSKITEKSWNIVPNKTYRYNVDYSIVEEMGESNVVIRDGELLTGVLDKGHYGNTPYGLVHCCYELYGGQVSGMLLTCFGRLFMHFLQMMRGFSLGVEDIIVQDEANKDRDEAISESLTCGPDSAAEGLGLEDGSDDRIMLDALKKGHFSSDDRRMRELDLSMKKRTDEIQNKIVKSCMPKGLLRLFPRNNLQLMVQSGAKGSSVNCMQISCLLGQIELEGRRPPPMLSGKTLPSFSAYDTSPRAGGFVSGRFLTGIRPQEYFFHCMAGREGLIDTAVKTSRSGYLQRCLIKHLEGVIVNYDMTVRDSDGSVVQFYYGEDGLDILKTGFIKPKMFPFLIENKGIMNYTDSHDSQITDYKSVKKWNKKVDKFRKKQKKNMHVNRKSGFLNYCKNTATPEYDEKLTVKKDGRTMSACARCDAWRLLDDKARKKFKKNTTRIDPITTLYRPYEQNGILPENMADHLKKFIKNDLPSIPEKYSMNPKEFQKFMNKKFVKSLAEPGESVGLLCAQSIGEPSTQMTLNTFHFAGRGEMNVTLGIPRLREILMVASEKILTPAMHIPVYDTPDARQTAKHIQNLFNKVTLSEVLEHIEICEYLAIKNRVKGKRSRLFQIKFTFLPYYLYKSRLCLTPAAILEFMESKYLKHLVDVIKRKILNLSKTRLLTSGTVSSKPPTEPSEQDERPREEEEEEESDTEIPGEDKDAADNKALNRHEEEQEYEEDLSEEVQDTGIEDVIMEGEESNDANPSLFENITLDMNDLLSSPTSRKKVDLRINKVLHSAEQIVGYKFDTKKQQWCEVTVEFGILDSKMDLGSLINADAKTAIVHQVPGIKKCFLAERQGPQGRQLTLTTEGINMNEVYKYADSLNVNELYSNDIHAMAATYGIEAAAQVLIKEVKNVFAAYGIEVDYRHMSLLADYMTFEGSYKPFNRKAIETSASPLQKMTFETTMNFLVNASIHGSKDPLRNPSSQLVVGRVVSCGSGTFDVLQPLNSVKNR